MVFVKYSCNLQRYLQHAKVTFIKYQRGIYKNIKEAFIEYQNAIYQLSKWHLSNIKDVFDVC